MRVRVDQDKCTGDGLCVQYAARSSSSTSTGWPTSRAPDGELLTAEGAEVDVPESLRLEVIDAAEQCPGECIYVTSPDGSVIGGPTA